MGQQIPPDDLQNALACAYTIGLWHGHGDNDAAEHDVNGEMIWGRSDFSSLAPDWDRAIAFASEWRQEKATKPVRSRAEWARERAEAVSALRDLCEEFGDNDWPDNLHLGDAIEKHLGRALYEMQEKHDGPAEG